MAFKDRIGLTKEQVRRIVLSKLKIVYRDWAFAKGPFWHREPKAGQRRIDPRSFETALLAALLGGLSEAIEKNNQVLFTALGPRLGASFAGSVCAVPHPNGRQRSRSTASNGPVRLAGDTGAVIEGIEACVRSAS